jgi:Domain of unknown function (DUF4124)
MKQVSIIAALLLVLSCPFTASGEMYSWIDENGAKHYSNEPPPPGTTVVEKEKEIPYDAERDQERGERDEQYFNELKQKNRENDKKIAEEAPREKEGPDTVIIKEEEEEDTWHQDRIEKRERIKHKRRNRKPRQ